MPSEQKEAKRMLTAELCTTEVQKYNPGKAVIPFAKRALMQAGIGIETVLRDQPKMIIAQWRRFDQEGTDRGMTRG